MGKHNWSLFSIWSLLFSKFSTIWRYYFNDQKQESYLKSLLLIVSWTFYFLKRKVKLSKVQTLHLSTSTRTKVTQENLEESQWELRVNILQRMDTQGDQHHWKRRKRTNDHPSDRKTESEEALYSTKDSNCIIAMDQCFCLTFLVKLEAPFKSLIAEIPICYGQHNKFL